MPDDAKSQLLDADARVRLHGRKVNQQDKIIRDLVAEITDFDPMQENAMEVLEEKEKSLTLHLETMNEMKKTEKKFARTHKQLQIKSKGK